MTTSLGIGTPTHASASPSPAVAAGGPAAAAPPHRPRWARRAVGIARDHLTAHAGELGLSAADVAGLAVSSVVPTAHNGLTNVYLQQRVAGIDVSNAMLNVAVTGQGTVFRVASSAVARAAQRANSATPTITAVAAARLAADALGLEPTSSFASSDGARGPDRARELGDGGISMSAIPAQLVYEQTDDGDLRLSWELVIEPLDGLHWWQIRMDARTGVERGRADWVAEDSHHVFPMPDRGPVVRRPGQHPDAGEQPRDVGLAVRLERHQRCRRCRVDPDHGQQRVRLHRHQRRQRTRRRQLAGRRRRRWRSTSRWT